MRFRKSVFCVRRPPLRVAGMSLIELMVAVALGLLILTGLVTVFVNSSAARNEVERTARQIENGRYAIEILSDDLRLAGYFGELDPIPANARFATPVPLPGVLPDPCAILVDPEDWKPTLFFYLQGYHNGTGLGAGCSAATNIKTNADATTNPDIVVVRRVRTCSVGDAGCEPKDDLKPYLQASLCATEIDTPYVLDLGSVAPTLHLKGASPTTCGATVALRQHMVHVYYISTDNGAGANVPSLKRLEYSTESGALAMKAVPLVEGIEQLNIEYGLDCAANTVPAPLVAVWPDGLPDVYTSDPSDATTYGANCDTAVKKWTNVVTARIYVLARNIDASPGYKDEKTYNLGRKPGGAVLTVGPFNDGYRRRVYSSLVRIANPAGRRDRPL